MKNLIILLSCLLFAGSVYGWGQKGHDVTAYIAECHLTPEAAQKIDKVLNGHSPVYYCNWMDIASHTPEYNYTKTWHYLNIDEGQTLETMPRNPKGDVLTAVTTLVAELKAGGLAPEAETEMLKMLIHLVGDMHCPMHTGRLSDIGGNQRPVLMFGRRTNLHSAWDSAIRAQVELHRVAGTDRPLDGRRGGTGTGRGAAGLAEGDPCDLRRHLRGQPRRDENILRLRGQIHARHRATARPGRLPAGTPAERDLPLTVGAK